MQHSHTHKKKLKHSTFLNKIKPPFKFWATMPNKRSKLFMQSTKRARAIKRTKGNWLRPLLQSPLMHEMLFLGAIVSIVWKTLNRRYGSE